MFPPLHKTIETRPSNNLKYEGGIGIYKTQKHSSKCTDTNFPRINLYKKMKDKE